MPYLKKKKQTLKKTVAVFGASFNPLHRGHINLLLQAQKHFGWDKIKVIPSYKSPLKELYQHAPPPEERLTVVKQVFKPYPFVEVDSQEIQKKGLSFTINILREIQKMKKSFQEIFLIIGMDQLLVFDQWKDFKQIIKIAHLVVCSRPSYPWGIKFLPKALQAQVKNHAGKQSLLKTNKSIYWLSLKESEVSSSHIREQIGLKKSVDHLLPNVVQKWIQKNNWYQKTPNYLVDQKKFLKEQDILNFCIQQLLAKKAERIQAFDMRQNPARPFDIVLLVSGRNIRHTKILASFLQEQLKKYFLLKAEQTEGQKTGEWIVLDYHWLVVHVFYDYVRGYYQLDDLWKSYQLRLKM